MTPNRRIAATLVAHPGLARLSGIRFAGQFGDGMFQAALGGAILFNPERESEPLAIAAGFAVLLLPYSVIGPFAGALLDRWDRRLVLLLANLLRGVAIVLAGVWLLLGGGSGVLLVLALTAVGISRFVLAGVSAALPHVAPPGWLVAMNSVLATLATGFAALGAGMAVALIAALGAGDTASAIAVFASASGSALGAWTAATFAPNALGPEGGAHAPASDALRAVAGGLRTGATAVWRAPGVTTAMLGILAHRIVFGADTLLMVLVLRRSGDVTAGLVGFGAAIAATGAGMLLAAAMVPLILPRVSRPRTITTALAMALLVQATIVAQLTTTALLAGALLLGLAGQTVKLTGDAAMQLDIDDGARGQVFALQDTVFNIAFVLALACAAAVVPADGQAPGVVLGAGGAYAAALAAIAANSRRSG